MFSLYKSNGRKSRAEPLASVPSIKYARPTYTAVNMPLSGINPTYLATFYTYEIAFVCPNSTQ